MQKQAQDDVQSMQPEYESKIINNDIKLADIKSLFGNIVVW